MVYIENVEKLNILAFFSLPTTFSYEIIRRVYQENKDH